MWVTYIDPSCLQSKDLWSQPFEDLIFCDSWELSTITRPKGFHRIRTSALAQLSWICVPGKTECFGLAETVQFSNIFRSPCLWGEKKFAARRLSATGLKLFKWAKYLNWSFTGREIQMADKYWRDTQTHLQLTKCKLNPQFKKNHILITSQK